MDKKSMVAEPTNPYQREPLSSRIVIGGCGATPPGGFFVGTKRQADNRAAGPKL
ncbi:hypothetical protein [Duncaniella freteri]|uniref:hypothetical protein n=1 Tax=Duncaniella freteri TaxID=2530391 RepID=UPI002557EF14|nr:hypothetical protein [Duncaniella freteri]